MSISAIIQAVKRFITSLPGAISLLGILFLLIGRIFFLDFTIDVTPLAPVSRQIILAVQITITIPVLISSLYVILSKKYEPDTEKWAYGSIGLILGYWMPAA